MKKLPRKIVARELKRVGFRVANPEKKLRLHQMVCILLGIAHPAFAFWLEMGTGKTRIALELLYYFWKKKRFKVALILAPGESALDSWEKQIKIWDINIPYVTLMNSPSADKWDAIAELETGLILATYPGFVRMCCDLYKKPRARKAALKPNPKKLKVLTKLLQAMVLDEATKVAHIHSLAYRICRKLAQTCQIRYELAGRPFGRDPTNLWAQLYLVDHGETLSDTLGMFRAGFFEEKANFWGGAEYKFKKSMELELKRILRHRTITYHASECIDLPKLNTQIVEVKLPIEAKAYYDSFVKHIKRVHAGFSERKNDFIRMRQVSSGFVGFKDDETGEKAEIAFADNPKLEALLELIDEIPEDCKFVIFYEFNYSGRLIHEALTRRKIKHEWLWGQTKNRREVQRRFDEDEKVRGLLLNHKLGAYALNLQRANYDFFYESPVPVIDREQAERRTYRDGQTRVVFRTDLVCKGTLDERILHFHKTGENLFKALIRNPGKALGG